MSRVKRPAKRRPSCTKSEKGGASSLAKAQRLTATRPKDAGAWKRLGELQMQARDFHEAVRSFHHVVDLRPTDSASWAQLGKLEVRLGNFDAAEEALKRALEGEGDVLKHEGHRLLSHIYQVREDKAQAIKHAEQAVALAQDDASCLATLAASLALNFELEKARELYRKAAALDSTSHLPLNNLAGIESQLGNLDAAISAYRAAHKAAPGTPLPLSNLITTLHYHPNTSQKELLTLSRQWNQLYADAAPPPRPETSRRKDKRLRIGMLSDGFRGHPVARMILAALEKVSPLEMSFTLYSTNLQQDSYTQRLKKLACQWTPVKHLSDNEVAQRVRDDQIDILFDLAGHNAGTRMQAMSMQPAPLIVKWVGGLINTTGVEAIDYLLSDAIETPPGCDDDYIEKLIRLPDDYICYEAPPYTPEINALPAKTNGYITLGCFNNGTKLNEVVLGEWATLMHQLPDSRLLLKSQQFKGSERAASITAFMKDRGIDAERVMIEGPSPHGELLRTYHRVDIALDPWPYSGGLTTCEAFTMGVPVVSLPGPTFAGRHSATHLINAGMPELVVSSWDEYRERVLELAADLDSLATIRRHLREVLLGSPVCDAKRFARHFTTAVRAIWQRHCEGKAPAALTFDKEGKAIFEGDSAPVEAAPVEPLAETTAVDGFRWNFEGRVIVVDSGARLLKTDNPRALLDLDALGVVAFDPASQVKKPEFLKTRDDVDLFAHACLGDGNPGELHATLDGQYSSLLEPESAERLPASLVQPMRSLTRLPISTIALDSIEGLPSIDWLALDLSGDTMAILENGEKALSGALLLQIQVPFQPFYRHQPDFAQVSHWAHRHGFRFRQFLNQRHGDPQPSGIASSEWLTADALFVPDQQRMAGLSTNQRAKLAFILATVFQADDAAVDAIDSEMQDSLARSLLDKRSRVSNPDTGAPEATMSQAWRQTAQQMIAANACARPQPHRLDGELVVSLTSYPARYPTLALTLESLLGQSVRPDHLILWIAHQDMDALPSEVMALKHRGLEIQACEDLRSYKKIVPALETFPNAFIATADDDLYYPADWLAKLVSHHQPGTKAIIAHRIHRIALGENGFPASYGDWTWNLANAEQCDPLHFPTTGAGVLFPPGSLHGDTCDRARFQSLCPDADDIWLYWMAGLQGYSARTCGRYRGLTEWPEADTKALHHGNLRGGNDRQIQAMIDHYGLPPALSETAAINAPAERTLQQSGGSSPLSDVSTVTFDGTQAYFHLPNPRDHIQRILRSSGSFYELPMLEDIRKQCRGGVIIDVGANIGNHSVFFGLYCGAERVLAFEPQPDIHRILERNIALNMLEDRVTIHAVGLASQSGYADLGQVDDANLGATKLRQADSDGKIPLRRLDDIVGDQAVDVLKVDVEGMEVEVLKGAPRLLERCRPVIYAEAATQIEFDAIKAYLTAFGYQAEAVFNATPTYRFACARA